MGLLGDIRPTMICVLKSAVNKWMEYEMSKQPSWEKTRRIFLRKRCSGVFTRSVLKADIETKKLWRVKTTTNNTKIGVYRESTKLLKIISLAIYAIVVLSSNAVFAHNKVVVVPLFGDDPPAPTVYAIGDAGPAGGIVFHVTNGGLNGLEAAPVDPGTTPWNCFATDIEGVANLGSRSTVDPNSGAVNTPLIAVQCPGDATNAAVLATAYVWPNGQTDGFLPNKEELNLLFVQRSVVGSLGSDFYWSSSELSSNFAWNQDFVSGNRFGRNKDSRLGVRAVRAF